jgi:hypothetical protein
MKYAVILMSSLVLLSCNYEHTSILPAAPSPPPVGYIVSGTVRDSAGRPIAEADVSYLVTTRGSLLWKTDAAGRFQISLRGGVYTFRVRKVGFETVLVPVRVDSDTTADFVLQPTARP